MLPKNFSGVPLPDGRGSEISEYRFLTGAALKFLILY
jgi:hypothetical protein